MLFGKNTQLNKIIPKAKFIKMANLSTQARKEFEENIDRFILANILRKDTINIEVGKNISEIDIFEIILKQKSLSDKIIKEIDSNVPKNILYCLRYKDKAQLVISFKEKGRENFKVIKIYRTEWISYENLTLDINGINLDSVFDSFIEQIAKLDKNTDIKEAIIKNIDKEKRDREIARLEVKLRNEKQFNKQLEIKSKIKELKQCQK